MAIYRCLECERMIDGDHDHGEEVVVDGVFELICDSCYERIENEDGEPGTWWTKVYGSKKREQGD